MIKFEASIMYYIGCAVMCVLIVLIIVFIMNMKKMIKNQEKLIDHSEAMEWQLISLNNQVHDIDNELYCNGGR